MPLNSDVIDQRGKNSEKMFQTEACNFNTLQNKPL